MRQAEMRRQAEEAARRKNYLESQSIKEKRIAHQNMLALNNQKSRKQVQVNEQMGYKRRVLDREADLNVKRNVLENVQQNQKAFLNYKSAHQNNHELRLQQEYKAKE